MATHRRKKKEIRKVVIGAPLPKKLSGAALQALSTLKPIAGSRQRALDAVKGAGLGWQSPYLDDFLG
jgi:hypothetical protein